MRRFSWASGLAALAMLGLGHIAVAQEMSAEGSTGERSTVLTLTAPNGGQSWWVTVPHTITWTATEPVGDVAIYLEKNGMVCRQIGTVPMDSGQFVWNICPLTEPGVFYTVRIQGIDPSFSYPPTDTSDGVFEIDGCAPPTLDVTNPAGGNVWTAGTTQTITWQASDLTGYTSAWLYKGGARHTFLGTTPTEQGELVVDLPIWVGDGDDYAVHLHWPHECCATVEADSPAAFSIVGSQTQPGLTLTSPNGGEVWAADTTQSITWNSVDPQGEVEVWLTDDATRFDYLGSAPMSDGQLTWPILPCIGDQTDYRILVRWADNDFIIEDTSDAAFQIGGSFTPTLAVTSPLAAELWTAGTTQLVTWTSDSVNGEVEIALHEDGYYNDLPLARVPVSDGVFAWAICPGIGDSFAYSIKLRLRGCQVFAAGDEFNMTGSMTPSLTFTSPPTGAQLTAGIPYTITWDAGNLCGDIDVVVPNDGWFQTGRISVPAAAGSFTWPVPPTLEAGNYHGVSLVSNDGNTVLTAASGAIGIVAGTPLFGDLNGDDDVDLLDFVTMQRNYTGRGPAMLDAVADSFDAEPDGDIDIDDAGLVLDALNGPAN